MPANGTPNHPYMTPQEFQSRLTNLIHTLEHDIRHAQPDEVVIDGQNYSPSDRAIPGFEVIYQYGSPDMLEEASDAVYETCERMGAHWEDGMLRRASQETDDNGVPLWSVQLGGPHKTVTVAAADRDAAAMRAWDENPSYASCQAIVEPLIAG